MPPSAITGMPARAAPSSAYWIAETCGTPTPATMRVVQIEPGPTPTLTASAPWSARAFAPSPVATLPPITCTCGKFLLIQRTRSSTPCEWPCEVSTTSTSTPPPTSASTRSSVSPPVPTAAPDPQSAELVLGRQRMLGRLEDVLHRDEAAQLHVTVDHEHALEPVLMHQCLGALEIGALRDRDELVALGHDARRPADRGSSRTGGRGW